MGIVEEKLEDKEKKTVSYKPVLHVKRSENNYECESDRDNCKLDECKLSGVMSYQLTIPGISDEIKKMLEEAIEFIGIVKNDICPESVPLNYDFVLSVQKDNSDYNYLDNLYDEYSAENGLNVFNALLSVASKYLIIRDNLPVCRYDSILEWHKLVENVGEDLMVCAFLAQKSKLDGREWNNFAWNPVIGHDNMQLNKVMERGLSDNHYHLFGSSPTFKLIWIKLMNAILPNGTFIDDYACIGLINNDINSSFAGERYLMYRMLRGYINGVKIPDRLMNWFYTYLVIKAQFRFELIQVNQKVGFDNFSYYSKRKNEFFNKQADVLNMIKHAVGESFYTRNLRSLEIRITPKKTAGQNMEYIETCDECIKEYLGDSICADTYYVFHFPKKGYKKTDIKYRLPFIECRHSQYREILEEVSEEIISFRELYPEQAGRVLGIDACSNELICRPEVFGTVYRKLRQHISSMQQLRMTYHVGEEWKDVADGLRAIDEAVKGYLESEFDKMYANMFENVPYTRGIERSINLYYESWKLRGDDPSAYITGKYVSPVIFKWYYVNMEIQEGNIIRNNRTISKLVYLYHYSTQVRINGEKNYNKQYVYEWLDRIRENGNQQSFKTRCKDDT